MQQQKLLFAWIQFYHNYFNTQDWQLQINRVIVFIELKVLQNYNKGRLSVIHDYEA